MAEQSFRRLRYAVLVHGKGRLQLKFEAGDVPSGLYDRQVVQRGIDTCSLLLNMGDTFTVKNNLSVETSSGPLCWEVTSMGVPSKLLRNTALAKFGRMVHSVARDEFPDYAQGDLEGQQMTCTTGRIYNFTALTEEPGRLQVKLTLPEWVTRNDLDVLLGKLTWNWYSHMNESLDTDRGKIIFNGVRKGSLEASKPLMDYFIERVVAHHFA